MIFFVAASEETAMTDGAPHLMAGFWRTRRSAAIAGIIFGVLLWRR